MVRGERVQVVAPSTGEGLLGGIGAGLRREMSLRSGAEHARIYQNRDWWAFQSDFVLFLEGSARAVANAPPGHGKSEALNGFIERIIAHNRDARILYASKTEDVAAKNTGKVVDALASNELLIRDFGPFVPRGAYNSRQFYCLGRSRPHKDPTLRAAGRDTNVEGERYTHIILDDPVNDEDMTSKAEREHARTWFDVTITKRLDTLATPPHLPRWLAGGNLWLSGARWHEADIYGHAVLTWGFKQRVWVARSKDPVSGALRALVPEAWPLEKLEAEERSQPTAFQLKFQQNIHALQGAAGWGDMVIEVPELPKEGARTVAQGWDYNKSEKEFSDYTAGVNVVLGVDGNLYVTDIFHDHVSSGHAERVRDFWEQHHPASVGSESNVFQDLIRQNVVKLNPLINIIPVVRKGDKVARLVGSLDGLFRGGRVRILRGCKHKAWFLSECRAFPFGEWDDTLDAFEAAVNVLFNKTFGLLSSDKLDGVVQGKRERFGGEEHWERVRA